MGYIVIDTETSSLFRHRDDAGNVIRSDAPGQPRMAEFAAILLDHDFKVEREFQSYIQPVGWDHDMTPEAEAVNGLSMEFLRANGRPVMDALMFYIGAVRDEGRIVVGFNQQHDGRVMRAELRRAGLDDLFETTPNICAMRSIHTNLRGQVKKLNGKGGFPRLIDAAAHFGIPYDESQHHSALDDARVTAAVVWELHKLGALLEPAVHHAKGFSGEVA